MLQTSKLQFKIDMNSKRRSQSPKNTTKSQSKSKVHEKKNSSPATKSNLTKKSELQSPKNIISQLTKKTNNLVKKKIEDLKPPELLIKVNYQGKRITIPIATCDDRSLHQTVMPHIIRFQREVLHRQNFSPSQICNWKTSGRGDILKDYYFQTNKPIKIFKDQLLEIQPIWRRKKVDKIKLSDFQIIKCIGTGGFSRVFLTRLKATGVFYALKLMEKEGLVESGKQCVVSNERNIMVGLNSPYIVNLQYAFETKHFVALALEYCPGGQLFFYLRKVKRMTEDEARYCFIEILLGLQYLHGQHIVYRDIKPQNIMIDMNGTLKIADFGLSKQGLKPNQLATTYCGSPQYMAPQMLAKQGHSYAVDYYCIGALLYELVTGNPPFYSRDVDKIYYSIQNQQIDFPSHIELSNEIKMLLQGLLTKDPRRRLGSMSGVRQILSHPWVRKLKAADIINKNVQTPIKIDLMCFNINEEEIQEGGDNFYQKFAYQDNDFQCEFQDFYFDRHEEMNILDDVLASANSESTKEQKSQNIHSNPLRDESKKIKGYKSSMSREKGQNYAIDLVASNHHDRPPSSAPRGKTQKKNLKKQKSKKQLNLVERAKKHDQKSGNRTQLDKQKDHINLKKTSLASGLKRIKSSTALLSVLKRQK